MRPLISQWYLWAGETTSYGSHGTRLRRLWWSRCTYIRYHDRGGRLDESTSDGTTPDVVPSV